MNAVISGAMVTRGSPLCVEYVAERRAGATGDRADRLVLLAAVARRTPAEGTPVAWLRAVRRQFWLYLGPFGPYGRPGGEDNSLYDADRRVVRVRHREYAMLPGDRTLVLLVPEGHRARAERRVVVRAVRVPILYLASHTLDNPMSGTSRRVPGPGLPGPLRMAAHAAWTAALSADPEVQAFLHNDAGAWRDAIEGSEGGARK